MPSSPAVTRAPDAAPVGDEPSGWFSAGRRTSWVVLLAGLVLVVLGGPLAELLARIAPAAVTVSSAGSPYPSLEEVLPTVWARLGLAMTAIAAVSLVVRRNLPPLPRRAWIGLSGVLAVFTGALHGLLAYPHHAFPTNARIHWVDILFDRADDWFYAAVKLPHLVFYDMPQLWQAVNGALNTLLVVILVRHVTGDRAAGLLAGIGFAASALMLAFADGAEDVSIGVTLLLLVALAHERRRPVLTGLALTLAVLGRPPFGVMAVALVVAEVAGGPDGTTLLDRLRQVSRPTGFLFTALAVFGTTFLAWQGWLTTRGARWLFADGRVIDRGLLNLAPREVDGFTISAFSGAYVGHALWIISLPVLAAAVVVVWRLARFAPRRRAVAALGTSTFVLLLAVNETVPLLYFNVRYLAYAWPLLYVAAWTVVTLPASAQPLVDRRVPVVLALLLAVAPATAANEAFARREQRVDHPVAQLALADVDLRAETGDRELVTTLASPTHRNYLAWLWRRPIDDVALVDADCVCPGAVLVTDDPGARERGRLLRRTSGVWVVQLADPSDDVDDR